MAEVIHPPRYTKFAPWLISADDLVVLDEVSARVAEAFTKAQDAAIDKEAREYWSDHSVPPSEIDHLISEKIAELKNRYARKSVPTIEILLIDDRVVRDSSLSELALQSDVVLTQTAAVTIEHEAYEGSYDIPKVSFMFNVRKGEISITGKPAGNPAVTNAFNMFRKWALERQPPSWQTAWSAFSGAALSLVLIFVFLNSIVYWYLNGDPTLKPAAQKLINQGVDASNSAKAIG